MSEVNGCPIQGRLIYRKSADSNKTVSESKTEWHLKKHDTSCNVKMLETSKSAKMAVRETEISVSGNLQIIT